MNTLEIYEQVISMTDGIERKGKANPYTSANGHMFSQMNKDGQLGFRFDKTTQAALMEKYNTTFFKSYGATMNGYILITDEMLSDLNLLSELLKQSHNYVLSLDPK